MGYSCWYTMFPVFALCINQDVSEESAMLYPELYQELRKGRALSRKTFFAMMFVALMQASLICILGLFNSLDYKDFSAITFTVLCFVLLLNIVYIINIWHTLIVLAVVVTFAIYPIFIVLQPMYFCTFPFVLIIILNYYECGLHYYFGVNVYDINLHISIHVKMKMVRMMHVENDNEHDNKYDYYFVNIKQK